MSDYTTSQIYKNNLKRAIKQRGFKLHEVAEGTGIPLRSLSDYCAGRVPIPYQRSEDVAQFIGCSVSYIRGDNTTPHDLLNVNPGNSEMNRKRRDLLQSLCIAGSTILLTSTVDWERLHNAIEEPSHVDSELVHDLEQVNHQYWKLFLAVSPKALVLDGVLGQLGVITQFLKESYPTLIKKQLCGLASSLSQLAGEIFFDLSDYNVAQSCYTFAASSAKEAGHYDLWACSLIRHAFLPLYNRQYSEALTLLQESRSIAGLGDSSLVTRFWIDAVEAEAQAGIHNLPACQLALENTQGVLSQQGGCNGSWLRFDGSRLSELQGNCFVRLQQPDLALPALKDALRQNPKPTRRRGMVLTDLARATLQRGEIERACVYANEVVDITLQGSGVLKKHIQSLRAQFQPFEEVDVVNQLSQRMRLLA